MKSEVERLDASGKTVVFDIDVAGGLRLKKNYPNQTLAVFIQAPNLEILEQRLRGRGTEAEDKIRLRLAKAEQEMATAERFDVIVVNDDLERAYANLKAAVLPFLDA